uniref:Phosphodiesterase n=1 Tax=Graphocephala atropunctata TaxID=36148 RepID=A0A1B6LGV0_9HEMI
MFPETMSSTQQPKHWHSLQEDMLKPQFYPDPSPFRDSLERLTKEEVQLQRYLSSNKNTLRVLAPYLRIINKDQKKLIRSARSIIKPKAKVEKVTFEKQTKEKIVDVILDLSCKPELIASITETGNILKKLLSATIVETHIVDPFKKVIYQSPLCSDAPKTKPSMKIEPGTTLAAYVAFSEEHVVTSQINEDKRFPHGIGYQSALMKHALCVPIKTPDDKVAAVYTLVRDALELPFEKEDLQIVLTVSGWIGVAVLQNSLYCSLARQQDLSNHLVHLTDHYHCLSGNHNFSLSNIVVFAKETIRAQCCRLFLVEEQSKDAFTVAIYQQGIEDATLLKKMRTSYFIKQDESALSKVLFNKEAVNKHYPILNCFSETEFLVTSLLCVPMLCGKQVIGAILLANKQGATKFSKEDKEILSRFATFCTINLKHLEIQEKLTKCEKVLNKVTTDMLHYHIEPCSHEQEMIKKHSTELPDNFFSFIWYPSPDETPKLVEYTLNMFHEVLGDSFMALNNVTKFVLTVQKCYRPNPYHNFTHAFGVAHTMANMISRYHKMFNGIEQKCLMVAALCHDLDHRGYNNNFVQLTKHHLSKLYESSPLENHHFAVTKMIIEQCGMFQYIHPKIYPDLLLEMYECIIATDLSLYFQCRMELMRVADERVFTFENNSHRRLVKSLMMTACDLSGQTKSFPVCKKITEDVYEEFYQQGDVEKKMGFLPLPTMDRDKKDNFLENQVQFMNVVVLPCVETVTRIFSTLKPMLWDTRTLFEQWKHLLETKDGVDEAVM